MAAAETPVDARAALWETWHALAHWHLQNEEGSTLIAQCRASGILSDETRACGAPLLTRLLLQLGQPEIEPSAEARMLST